MMLVELSVRNLGVIEDLHLVLGPGMTVITGETGAGKTLLVEAIELLMGGRAEPGLVRRGAVEAGVDGCFVHAGSSDDDDHELLLTRIIPAEGRSRAAINGRVATASALSEQGVELVDLYGQHAHQSLLSPAVQRDCLDDFAGDPVAECLVRYRSARAEIAQLRSQMSELGGDAGERLHEIELLRFQCDEIAAAAIVGADEETDLEAQETLLGDAQAHREVLEHGHGVLASRGLDAVGDAIGMLATKDAFAAIVERMRGIQAELTDVVDELRRAAEGVVEDPARLDEIAQRRRMLHDLRRKYGPSLGNVIESGERSAIRLAGLENASGEVERLSGALEEMEKVMQRAGEELRAARRGAAELLARQIESHLHALAMPGARFSVEVDPTEPGESGADEICFLLGANPGEPMLPLARAASGGELARTMLAARLVLSGAPPTLVFDEVDAGIGGEAGTAVGAKLAALSQRHQVFCVTHLPQVAAFADTHVLVGKSTENGRTVATARVVDGEARVQELSRMLAGVSSSGHARSHAEELLVLAMSEKGDTGRPAR